MSAAIENKIAKEVLATRKFAAAWLEKSYMKRRRRNLKLVLEDLDFSWDEDELRELARMNNEGSTIEQMNEVFRREDEDEIFLALFHLARHGRIKRIDLRRLLA